MHKLLSFQSVTTTVSLIVIMLLHIKLRQQTHPKNCTIKASFPKMDGPVFMFYELTNFFQNHRRYVKSKSNNQLSNLYIGTDEAKKFCEPVTHNSDLFDTQFWYYVTADGRRLNRNDTANNLKPLDPNKTANPCGLIAKSVFNDTYQIYKSNGTRVKVSEKGISWPNDAGTKFKSSSNETSWIDVQNEHFIVWMRTAGLPSFRKLWGTISNGFEGISYKQFNVEGVYTIKIENNYDPSRYQGEKNLFFSTSSAFGGKNPFLGIGFLVVGSLCFCIAVFFQGYSSYSGKKYGQKSS